MSALSKGQNGPLTVDAVVVDVTFAALADVSALLVTDRGVVRSDNDFVFYNQPMGPGVQLKPGPGRMARLHVVTGQVPADIAAVRTVITLDDAGLRFGQFPAPIARILDVAGNELYSYMIEGLSSESVVVAIEIYRRGNQWKVRAVGQGYAGGFADLVRDHGVSVDDEPTPPPPVQAPQPVAAPAPVPEISLSKNRPVNLVKGQRVTLRKDGNVALTDIAMALGWDPGRGRSIDLDASVLMYSGSECMEIVCFYHLRSNDGSIVHSGDNLTGHGEGDDETISIALQRIPPHIDKLGFTVTSFLGQSFKSVQNAYCRLVDTTTNTELARYTLNQKVPHTAILMAAIDRQNGEWKLRAIGEGFSARTPKKAAKQSRQFM
ncbi:TerD family protein [Gordonia sp. (in: high G+C Gram-positive bacteria)]|jgi:stress response protein SCP2|uniref:TerD family protein n=2 Tax=Gordonia sp. (in: high G+C Gram-positive bacteria) TaxID=84139 RepID=UPI00262F46E1|nr:TerD family protein [Gordonia sp. (in: high G+C Gram-positive bacteria)]HMS77452.1 TerD family protein [Gordonia sp. (in: high G+C Gram-positive bacteria)]HQV17037.1 TerD family protein [Gordonia sp. (in: high G+C Gram-positive bacteria)]